MADIRDPGVPFSEAIDFLRNKVDLPTRSWTDIWQGMHSQAFVVAGAQSEALVSDFHEAVNKAIQTGGTLEQFRQNFDRIVSDHGWQHNGTPGWRSRVIFETNLRTAYAAGRWAQIQRTKKLRPYLRYVTVEDDRVRPEHRAWHNVVLPVDHPWWDTHFPPCGWGCRCRVVSLSEADLKRYGLKVWDNPPESRYVAKEVRTPEGPVTIQVPEGIDPGFAYNPGLGAFGRGPELLAEQKHGDWNELMVPDQEARRPAFVPVDNARTEAASPRPAGDIEGYRSILRSAIGGDERISVDPTGAPIRFSQAIVDQMAETPSMQDGREQFFPFLVDLITDPAEIWMGFVELANGRVMMRRRYLKIIALKDGRQVGLVIDADGRQMSGFVFSAGLPQQLDRLRSGLLLYARE